MVRFYASLEGILKRHNPVEYILEMGYRFHECSQDDTKWRRLPPFRVVHSIEACCALRARAQPGPGDVESPFQSYERLP